MFKIADIIIKVKQGHCKCKFKQCIVAKAALMHSLVMAPLIRADMTYYQLSTSSSCMRVINHNWSATKQRPHLQSVAEISHHSVLSGDRIRQCETSSGIHCNHVNVFYRFGDITTQLKNHLYTMLKFFANLYMWENQNHGVNRQQKNSDDISEPFLHNICVTDIQTSGRICTPQFLNMYPSVRSSANSDCFLSLSSKFTHNFVIK